jgi:cytochrome c-type protein NapC
MNNQSNGCTNFICRMWSAIRSPSKYSLGVLLIIGFVTGIIFWGGFHYSMEVTNTEEFLP